MKPMKLDIQMFATPLPVRPNINFKDITENELPESLTFSFDGEQAIIQITGISEEYFWTSSNGGNTFDSITIETEGYSIIVLQVGDGTGTIYIDVYKNSAFTRKIIDDNVINQTTPDFSQSATTDEGIFTAEDNDGISAYFRGAVTNNYVKFANFWWRIIRVNGNGSIRLIYDGTTAHANGESSTDRQIDTSAFNTNSNDNAYVGYMYGTPGSSTHEATHANINNSAIKTILDSWYESNLSNPSDYIDTEAGFCGDRTPYSGSGTGTTRTYYAPYNRLFTNKTPSFECTNNSDLYTTTGSEDGNKALQYPIGLISTDEVAYAGGVYNTSNSSYYLCIRNVYWTMSPSSYSGSAGVFCVGSNGRLGWYGVRSAVGVRPVINLRGDLFVTGTGTSTDPYEVSLSVVPATIFNGTELTNIYYNGTEISKMYCNGTLVFEKGPTVYKRRIMVGDDLSNRTIFQDFPDGFFLVDFSWDTSRVLISSNDIDIYEKLDSVGFYEIYCGGYPNLMYSCDVTGAISTTKKDVELGNYSNAIVTQTLENEAYRHIFIEDENIRPLQVGDILTNNTILYFNFPDNLGVQAINSYNQEKFTEDVVYCSNNFRIYGEVNGSKYKICVSVDENSSTIYSSNLGNIEINSSFMSLELSGSFMSTGINSTNVNSILYDNDYILVDTTTLSTGGGHGH